ASDSPVHLSLQELGIDNPSAVMDRNVAQDVEGTGVTVHCNDSHMRTEAEGIVTQNKMRGELQAHIHVRWQLLALLCCSSHFSKGESVLRTSFVHQFAVLEHNILRSAVQEMRRQKCHFLVCSLEPFIHCRAAQR